MLVQATRVPSQLWCLLVSAYLALSVSRLPPGWKDPATRGLGTLLLLSLALAALNVASRLVAFYGARFRAPDHAIGLARNIARVVILVIALLMLLDIWGVPTSP